MAAPATVRVRGLAQVNRAFKKLEGEVAGELKDKLKDLAEPVAADARASISRYVGAQTNTIKPRALTKSVFVTQGARKRSGMRPDFGALQMRILLGSLYDNEDEIYEGVDDLLNYLARKEGF
jgi:hypothetical protein